MRIFSVVSVLSIIFASPAFAASATCNVQAVGSPKQGNNTTYYYQEITLTGCTPGDGKKTVYVELIPDNQNYPTWRKSREMQSEIILSAFTLSKKVRVTYENGLISELQILAN